MRIMPAAAKIIPENDLDCSQELQGLPRKDGLYLKNRMRLRLKLTVQLRERERKRHSPALRECSLCFGSGLRCAVNPR